MGRRNDGLLDALVTLSARLPWWVGVGLALASYLICHHYASQPLPTTTDVGQLGQVGVRMMGRTLAQFGQYLLPLAFLFGAGVSWYRRRRGKALHAEAGARTDALPGMSWGEFESLVGEYFRQRGFGVVENDGPGPDGGVDLRLRKGSDRYLVQCKHWRARKVGVEPVRELYGLIAAQRAAGGFVVTSGEFTAEAKRFAEGREIKLIPGEALRASVRQQRARNLHGAPPNAAPAPTADERAGTRAAQAPAPGTEVPPCPQCQAPMVRRTATRGRQAGSAFWGCSRFPRCKGTRTA
ncbi:MAG TPA: restriction endonuclease [Burkholderiaceae bacterium]|nr:restriction endonuclease [Burkholderiaceae bacterium]